uniref:Uncharacterized protein n=1 Tax=Romanomermis culicivorax TaxID=13658 RepID=A0A915KMV6_ROMCU
MYVNVWSVAMFISASIPVGWMGVDSSIGAGAMFEISSSISFKKSVICVAVALRSDGAAGIGRADTSVDGGSLAMFKSKISISKISSSAGSTSTPVGQSSSSSAMVDFGGVQRVVGKQCGGIVYLRDEALTAEGQEQ